MRPPKFRRIALGLVAPTALALAACGASDVSRSQIQEQLEEGELTAEQASCVTDRLFEDLEPGEITDLYEADTDEDISDETNEAFDTALEECAASG